MNFPFQGSRPCRFFSRDTLLALTLLASGLGVQADTRFSIGTESAAGCYCHCAMSKARGGCAKICETPKYASRWWATSCTRPRRKAPVDNPGAHPRLPRPAGAIPRPDHTVSGGRAAGDSFGAGGYVARGGGTRRSSVYSGARLGNARIRRSAPGHPIV